jgi:DNA repair exonuclease SbcCD ATPase subunit
MDAFLDDINRFKSLLNAKSEQIKELIVLCEALTWLDIEEGKDAALHAINRLIGALGRLHSILEARLIGFKEASKKLGIAKNELRIFSNAVRDLKEMIDDLDMVFFRLPAEPEMQAVAHEISKLTSGKR